ncbi:MAG: DUF4338 domain-containing protein, partial [Reyranella sp.]|nr:DUF4338 domain-containing protein [Reyranella sp.]
IHTAQRNDRLALNKTFLAEKLPKLLKHFASGQDVDPAKISPVLQPISSSSWEGDLFRLASLTWSVPVSNGFGRRLRFLVWDENNGKLIGIIAIGDPVGTGLVDSLARPGGNVTGLSQMFPSIAVKRLELLRELAPRISRVLVPSYLSDPVAAPQVNALQETARSLGVTLQRQDIRTPDDLAVAFEAGVKERVEGVLTTGESIFVVNRARLVELAARYRLPGVYHHRAIVEAGGLMAYQGDVAAQHRRAATYVDRLLKGARPADLPIEQPARFDLTINLRTAKALDLTVPPSLLVRADEVIE